MSGVAPGSGSLAADLSRLPEPRADRLFAAAVLALAGHVGVAWLAASRPRPAPVAPPPVDVELMFREPPPEPPPPEPELPPEPAPPAPEPPRAPPLRAVAKAAPPPPAARAGAVLTAAPEPAAPPSAAEPFDFTSDPNSPVYGSGVVAVGGSASRGLAGARAGGSGVAPAPRAAGNGLTAASDLRQKPRLRDADPCRGYFPDSAREDLAAVSVRVVIMRDGRVTRADVVSESPRGQGFGAAARRCMLAQSFVPALDRSGNAAATALNVNVKFSR